MKNPLAPTLAFFLLTASAAQALTTDDVDLAPECEGLATYVNTATFAELDAFLPSNVAQAIVDTRAFQPFDSIASLLSVSGLGPSRLQQILSAAREASLVGPSCAGIYDELAISTDDDAAIVAYVNAVSTTELDGVLYFLINPATFDNLLAARPYAAASAISTTAGVGPVSFRALRDAANFRGPFEELAWVVNTTTRVEPVLYYRIYPHAHWRHLLQNIDPDFSQSECFGIDPWLVPQGGTLRAELADEVEVMDSATQATSVAVHVLGIDPSLGLADLASKVAGRTFSGCHIRVHADPWTYERYSFFIDTDGSARLFHRHFEEL